MSYALIVGAVVSAGSAAYSAHEKNKAAKAQAKQSSAAAAQIPYAPNLLDTWKQGNQDQIDATPDYIQRDMELRQKYLPQQNELALDQYAKNLPKYAKINQRVLNQVDPQFVQGRNQLYQNVSRDLSYGTQLTPDFEDQLNSYVRGGQAARGNVLGAAPVSAEGMYKGDRALALYQQRIGNAQNFVNGASPESKYSQLAGLGSGAITGSNAIAQNPGYSYLQGPQNWGDKYANLTSEQFGLNGPRNQANAQAASAQNAPMANPWMDAVVAGIGSAAGGASSYVTNQSSMGGAGNQWGTGNKASQLQYDNNATNYLVSQAGSGQNYY